MIAPDDDGIPSGEIPPLSPDGPLGVLTTDTTVYALDLLWFAYLKGMYLNEPMWVGSSWVPTQVNTYIGTSSCVFNLINCLNLSMQTSHSHLSLALDFAIV